MLGAGHQPPGAAWAGTASGSVCLDFSQLAELISALAGTGPVVGLDAAVYDPDLDPDGAYAAPTVDCIASALTQLATVETHA
ncbi:hypothetical protein [Streptomyces milbemycinicus]|uniref:Arginase n=1 Tax=Streptomyces milbemycinicus TaxID=476552 RepID=A0ABW8LIA1_9ACTN